MMGSTMSDRKIPVTEAMVERQIAIEEEARTRAIQRSRAAVKQALEGGRASELLPVSKLIGAAFETVSQEIDSIKASKVAGVGGKYRKYVRLVSTDVLASAALTIVLDMVCTLDMKDSTIQSINSALGRMVQSEILAKNLSTVAPAYMNRVQEYLKERGTRSPSHIMRTFRASAEAVNLNYEPWSNSDNIATGNLLMQAVYSTGLFEWKDSHQMKVLQPSAELEKVLTDVITHSNSLFITPPMIVPPVPHTDLFNGGYLTNAMVTARRTYRNRHISNRKLREVASAFENAPELRAAMNKAQEVPYRVNKGIYQTMLAARAQGIGIGMPSTVARAKPEWRLDGTAPSEYTVKENEEFALWKVQMRNWYTAEAKRVSQLRGQATTIELCREYMNEPALYFPTCVDWRYRLYFKSALNPQGSDLQKALLELAEGVALGERGLGWLKWHVATTYGYDKKLRELRINWTDEHIDIIRQVVADPLNSQAFAEADSPWCFLAACTDLVAALDSGNPETYESHVPVAVDATNSGGQHLSALMRDSVGGRLTNLFWEGKEDKADMYMDVKKRTDTKVDAVTDAENIVQAHYWKENPITRAMTKRPSMTFFYSATLRSCQEYVVRGAVEEGYKGIDDYSIWALGVWLAPLMRSAIEDAMPAAAEVMQYLQNVCKRVPVAENIQWKTPLGGLVINRYATQVMKTVRISSMGISRVVAYNTDYDRNNRPKAASGIAPNFVHSLDSTHLLMTILRFEGRVVPIHDSAATHAAHMDELNACLRSAFVDLYRHNNPLETIQEAAVAAGADLSDLEEPTKGDLNINLVLDSPFFFC